MVKRKSTALSRKRTPSKLLIYIFLKSILRVLRVRSEFRFSTWCLRYWGMLVTRRPAHLGNLFLLERKQTRSSQQIVECGRVPCFCVTGFQPSAFWSFWCTWATDTSHAKRQEPCWLLLSLLLLLSGSGLGPVEGSYEYGYEHSGSIRCTELLLILQYFTIY
jgi:hypothetical protein